MPTCRASQVPLPTVPANVRIYWAVLARSRRCRTQAALLPWLPTEKEALSLFRTFSTRRLLSFKSVSGKSRDVVHGAAAAMIAEAIQKCDVDVRRDMWAGIVLTGGGALLPGLRERLEQVTTPCIVLHPHVGPARIACGGSAPSVDSLRPIAAASATWLAFLL